MNQLTIINHGGVDAIESRLVADAIDKSHAHLMRDIAGYIANMEEVGEPNFGLSSRELKIQPTDFFIPSTYISEQNKELPCYLLTKKGCDMVANKMTGKKGVLFTAAYVTAFESMREHIQTEYTGLSPQLQLLINMEVEQKRQAAALVQVNNRMDNISEIVSLDANAWRDKTKSIIVKIADKWGGAAYIQEVHKELYRLLEQSARVNLKRRLDNRKSRMLTEGASKTAIHKVNNLDIIADDPKLVPIYLDLVKRMAIKHEIGVQGLLDEVVV